MSLQHPGPAQPPAEPEPGHVSVLHLGVHFDNGASREYTARWPLGYRMAIEASGDEAGLAPGLAGPQKKEPWIMVVFAGNPAEGGVQVHGEGVPP